MKIAVLTGGGDCPGLNPAIRAVVRRVIGCGHKIYGIFEGWSGLYDNKIRPLNIEMTSGILAQGGTILGTARMNPLKLKDGVSRSLRNFRKNKLDALISIGGEGTLKIAQVFSEAGIAVVCVPKTIDNDAWGTDYTIGFDTAVQIATEAVDRIHTTAESHNRIMIVEVMGRHAGWIALYTGIAGGADAILIPERVFPIEELLRIVKRREARGRHFSIFVASEDAKIGIGKKVLSTPVQHDEYGDVKLGGIGELLARELRKRTDSEVRVTVLGHIQRGGTPSAFDRILATRMGIHAVDLVLQKQFGQMVVIDGNHITSIPMSQSAGRTRTVDPEIEDVARVFFG